MIHLKERLVKEQRALNLRKKIVSTTQAPLGDFPKLKGGALEFSSKLESKSTVVAECVYT